MSNVRPSPEVLAIARRWIEAVPNRRPNDLRNLMTKEDHLLFFGTAEDEIWSGHAVQEGVGAFFGAIPSVTKHVEHFAEAYENGNTGWACLTHEIAFETHPDRSFLVRTTLILTLEDGAWKIVHRHGSVPTPNEDFTGVEQPAIADLVAAVKDGFALDQTEGLASIMFTDIVGSSALASALGDRAWSPIIAAHFDMIRAIVTEHDGQFVKSLGDGTMSSFPSARACLSAATQIQSALESDTQEPHLSVRIGIHTGEVMQAQDDFFGTVVNKAARITATAQAQEIRVSDTTRLIAGNTKGFVFSGSKDFDLKGLEGRHTTHLLVWQT
ncbi:pH-sensitive adenylate cyclase [Falsiruegeria litorea R37]|uniref:pH-sensitive adenylate cyclase n=1 Tax=Falsiruegeria litorea R37 TaxID=1200284 RepID=A0A1Y5S3W4_9RHOB|nr:adenylate/guanylate cyclase domain-containing protein [Falsiruegeria litorea]SLN31078.1 pH-sensitive adenylate cyclase [Falsiruegeria litorea R37]